MRVSREIEPLISEEGRAMVLITRTAHLIDLEKKRETIENKLGNLYATYNMHV